MKHQSLFYFTLALFALSVLIPAPTFGQCGPECGTCAAQQPPLQGPIISPRAGIVLPSKGVINALVVFIDFEDETEDVNNPNWRRGDGPIGIGPTWMGQFIDLTPEQQSGQKFNITTYYRDMSFGQFTIVGYPIYRRARRTLAAYKADPNTTSNIPYWTTREVLTSLTAQDVGGWSRFDTITTNRFYQQHVGPDGVLDLVIVCYRGRFFNNGWPAEGFAYLGTGADYWLNGGPKVMTQTNGSGVTWQYGLHYPDCWVPFHEVGHLLLGGLERYNDANGGLWSVMGERNVNVSYFMNAYEREQLGWITFNEATDGLEIDVPDFGTTGTAYRMAYPGSEGFLEYYFENHQSLPSPYIKVAPDNSMSYDLVDKRDLEPGGGDRTKGLYIVENDGYQFRVVCADGRWIKQSTGTMPNPFNPGLTTQIFQDQAVDRNTGRTDRLTQRGSYMGQNYNEFVWVWRDEVTGQATWIPFSGRHGGDGHDAWKSDGNNVFSPWSNPAARFSYNELLQAGGMQVLRENGDGTVRVKFITSDVQSLPPSLPQMFRASTIEGFNNTTHPSLTWTQNVEPTMVDGSFEVWRQLEPYGGQQGAWTHTATLPSNQLAFVDETITGARREGGGNIAHYKIRVVDVNNKLSNYTKEWTLYYGDSPLKPVRHEQATKKNRSITAQYVNDNVVIRTDNKNAVIVRLFNVLGQQLFATEECEIAPGLHAIPLSTDNLPAGHYHCVIYIHGIASAYIPITK